MARSDGEPVLPWRIPPAVIALLIIVIVLITLGGLAIVVSLVVGSVYGRLGGMTLSWPDGQLQQAVWIQSALMLLTMFVIWIFSILVVGAHASGSHRNAAGNAIALVRVLIAILVVHYLVGALTPFLATGAWQAVWPPLAAGAPLLLVKIALLIAADAYFGAVRENAPS